MQGPGCSIVSSSLSGPEGLDAGMRECRFRVVSGQSGPGSSLNEQKARLSIAPAMGKPRWVANRSKIPSRPVLFCARQDHLSTGRGGLRSPDEQNQYPGIPRRALARLLDR